ncbi:MAG: Do family serine endopeptidase [Proteobacteria bacterium]|nr:Do family serine endopeptidase [Pseudomonadota bacterium]
MVRFSQQLKLCYVGLCIAGCVMAADSPQPIAVPTLTQDLSEVSLDATSLPVVPDSREALQMSYAPVVDKVSPCVVNIYATRIEVPQANLPYFSDPLFRHFFGDGSGVARVQKSLGSGVVVSKDGVIVTNLHVIQHAAEIKVAFADDKEFTAKVLAKDARTDLAILKIEPEKGKPFPFLAFRDADTLRVGDFVLAVGNPFGVGQTVTSGIVSGLARTQVGVSDLYSLIQTDAAINPGNSGGPLVTLDGKIVGINTAIFSTSGGSVGIGFAIPSNLVLPLLAAAEHGGKLIRPWAGVAIDTVTNGIATALGLPKTEGVLVRDVYKKGPADKAGLTSGDVVLKIAGHPLRNEAAFRFRMATLKVGETVSVEIWRQGENKTLSMRVETPPDLPGNRRLSLSGRQPLNGAVVTGLSPSVANELGLSYVGGGVVILGINPGTPASLTGLQPGDVVVSINGVEVKTVDELSRNLGRSKQGWEITFTRGSRTQTLVVGNW